jgi:hypothetical protein
MDALLSIALGVGLSAACGFRIFVPLLIVSVASFTGHLDLAGGFNWMGSLPALVVFGTATLFEVVGYYIPWVDNILDTLSGPAAVVAGTMVAASQFGEFDPLLMWSLALIAGGGTAGLLSGTTAVVRGASTVTTAGLGNPIIATVELVGSVFMSLLALVAPLLALLVVLVAIGWLANRLVRRRARAPKPGAPS